MTIREKLTSGLIERGVWGEDVPEILKRYTDAPIGAAMKNRLDDDLESYPLPVYIRTWLGVRRTAHAFYQETTPDAWFLPMLLN